MPQYIDVDTTAVLIDRYKNSLEKETDKSIADAINDIVCWISPKADVVEVKHGKWEQKIMPLGWQDIDCAECSVCEHNFMLTESEMSIKDILNWLNYCPNCGAKMDLEVEE